MTAITHPKKRGEWVETLFLTRAVSLGLAISKPWGDCLRYDFIIDAAGRLLRVQVKGTSRRRGRCYMSRAVSCCLGNLKGTPYTAEEVDFFAFYLIPEDVWYIIPLSEVPNPRQMFCLNPHNPNNRYECFREAWHLLGAA
jgi:hypothetical protein